MNIEDAIEELGTVGVWLLVAAAKGAIDLNQLAADVLEHNGLDRDGNLRTPFVTRAQNLGSSDRG
jgi:hypothetical protein